MESIDTILARWEPDPDDSPEDSAHALARRLTRNDIHAEFVEEYFAATNSALVFVDATPARLVLIAPEDEEQLRQQVSQLILHPPFDEEHRLRLVGARKVPADIAWLLSDPPVFQLEQALVLGEYVPMTMPLAEIGAAVARIRPVLEQHFGVALDPAGGVKTFETIDDLVLRFRPGPEVFSQTDHVAPISTLVALGLVATETARTLAGGGEHGAIEHTAWRRAETLRDVEAFPDLRRGRVLLRIAKKVLERWEEGRDVSVLENWELSAADAMTLPEPGDDEWAAIAPPTLSKMDQGSVGLAPYAVYALVTGIEKVTTNDVRTLLENLGDIRSNLLKEALMATVEPAQCLVGVVQHKQLGIDALKSAGSIARSHPAWNDLREDLLQLAVTLATAKSRTFFGLFGGKSIRKADAAIIDRITNLLDGTPAAQA